AFRFQLVAGVQLADEPPRGERQRRDEQDGVDGVALFGPRTGSVVENGSLLAHRFTLTFLATQPRHMPIGRVGIAKPTAKMTTASSALSLSRPSRAAISAAAAIPARAAVTVVFLVSASSTEASGATTDRNACGSTTMRSTWKNVRPSALAAP